MTLKIKASTLKTFLVKTTADGTVEDAKLVFGEKGLSMTHTDKPGVIFIGGVLEKTAFVEYEILDIELKSTKTFIQALGTFGDDAVIQIARQNNMAKVLDESGSFDLALAEKVECFKDGGIPDISYDNQFIVKKSLIENIEKRSQIVKSDSILVQNSAKELVLAIGKDADQANVKMPTICDLDRSAQFDLAYFKKVTKNLDLAFDMSIGQEGIPLKIQEMTDKYKIIYFLTPITNVEAK